MAATCGSAAAQDSGGRGYSLVPSFAAVATSSDVRRADQSTADVITQLKPGLQWSSRSGRTQSSLTYTLDAINHSRQGSASEIQNALNGTLSVEAIEGFAFLEANATVSQRSLAAYGEQTVSDSQVSNPNRVEVGTVSVAPYLRGALGSLATYEVRLNASATNARHSKTGDSTSMNGLVTLNSASGGSIFGWGLQASHQRSEFREGRATESDRASATLSARPDPELALSLRGGRESNNVVGTDSQGYNNYGGSIAWTPNARTSVVLDTDRRYFGQSLRVNLDYRLPLSALHFSTTRDASTSSNPNGVGQPVTLYQLYDSLLLSKYPDPVERDQAVRQQLTLAGLDPNAIVGGGSLTSSTTLQRRSDLGWTYQGVRLTVGLQAFMSESSVLDAAALQPGDGSVRQRGYTVSLGYRLTPNASASLAGSQLTTLGNATNPGTDLKSVTMALNQQVGRYISTSLSARYSVFNSATDPYRESAVTASLSLQF